MANNVEVNPGSGGAVLGTEQITGVHYQKFKLTDGTPGSTAAITGDASNGLDVDVTRLPALVASSATIGKVDLNAGTNAVGDVGIIPRASGGLSIFLSIDVDESSEQVKGSAGQVFSIMAFNHTADPLYLKFYNNATPTVGTTTPALVLTVPGNGDLSGAGVIWNNDIGLAFGTAISVACTTGIAHNSTSGPAANACSVNVGYK